jgi:hypothetical protein
MLILSFTPEDARCGFRLGFTPERIAVGDVDPAPGDDVVLDFADQGLFMWTGATATWTQLHGRSASALLVADLDGNGLDDVIAQFSGAGISGYHGSALWTQMHPREGEHLAAGHVYGDPSANLVVDFGGEGGWAYLAITGWSQLFQGAAEDISLADLDADGFDDVILNRGAQGIWRFGYGRDWTLLDFNVPVRMEARRAY